MGKYIIEAFLLAANTIENIVGLKILEALILFSLLK